MYLSDINDIKTSMQKALGLSPSMEGKEERKKRDRLGRTLYSRRRTLFNKSMALLSGGREAALDYKT